MMKSGFFSICIVVIAFNAALSQDVEPGSTGYYVEALSNSRVTQNGGSARVVGLSGAQTSLGADLGSLSSNPAGLGVYRKSEVAGSLALRFTSTSSNLYGKEVRDMKPNFGVNHIGVAFCGLRDDIVESDWRGGTFAISMNNVQTYNNAYTYQANNANNSAINAFIGNANGTNATVYDDEYVSKNITSLTSLAYNTFLITPDSSNSNYYGYIPPDKIMLQKGSVNTRGAVRSWAFGYGGNYKNHLFFGASLNIIGLNRTVEQTYSEQLLNGGPGYLNNFTLTDKYSVMGTGYNLTLGVIYRINDAVRIGSSFKTPEIFTIKEQYDASITSNFNNIVLQTSSGDPYYLKQESASMTTTKFNYTLYTPLRFSTGVSVFFGKRGFWTIEGEYLNYQGMSLSKSGSNYFTEDNVTIKNIYVDVINVRTGLELRHDVFRFRLGGAFFPSPYQAQTDTRIRRTVSDATTMFSTGVGLKFENLYFDIAFNRTNYTSHHSPYLLGNGQQPLVMTNNGVNVFVATLGANF